MAQKLYTERPTQYLGEQYLAGGPLPAGAVAAYPEFDLPAETGPYLSTPSGIYPIRDTNWVLSNRFSGQAVSVVTNAEFTERFSGPNVEVT